MVAKKAATSTGFLAVTNSVHLSADFPALGLQATQT